MTYTELSQIKTPGFVTNNVIDDVLNNGRFCYTKAEFKGAQVPEFEVEKIMFWARKEGCELSTEMTLDEMIVRVGVWA
jgi:hypothetical protein